MTHTLHPDTLIARIMEEVEIFGNHSPVCVNDKVIRFVKIDEGLLKSIISKHLLPPSQHLKDGTKQCTACLGHKTHSKYTASKGTIEVNCSRCNGTGLETVYDEKPKTYTFEQMEAEYDRGFTNGLLAIGGKKEGLKQSTPKIEKIELTKDDDYWGDTHKKLNEVIDYINNKD